MGTLGIRIEPYGKTSAEETQDIFRQQAEALLEGGVDLFVLETFSDVTEIQQALLAVRSITDLPVVAQMTIQTDGNTSYGTRLRLSPSTRRVGRRRYRLNCSVGRTLCSKRSRRCAIDQAQALAQPNGGLPRR